MPAPEAVLIADYDPRWPHLFEEERERIAQATRPYVLAIEHVGSTAVPGLAAKPAIDIMPGLFRLGDAQRCIERMEALGFAYSPELEARFPERRYLSRGLSSGVKYHVHMVEVGSAFWERHLLFRDWLRAHPEEAAAYAALKHELAAKYGSDREGYAMAKGPFIAEVEEKAKAAFAAGTVRTTP